MDFLNSLPPLDNNNINDSFNPLDNNNNNNNNNNTKKKIHRLSPEVVNKISAGEVIQRPSNALKELLENSLDAKSTNIIITVKDGGMKLLQIQDNGTGIRLDDMEIVCERFTTSKLTKFEDLRKIASFGFRGEALSSISHVSHLKIQTKTADSNCAYRACYFNGKLSPSNPNDPSSCDPKPCAGVNGTQITVEDLFFNTPSRKSVLKNFSEEHSRISQLIKKYAINNPKVGFTLKKLGEPTPEVITSGNLTEQDVISSLFGNDLAKDLKEITLKSDKFEFDVKALITNTNYNSKKTNFILFVNGRLVDSKNLKVGLEQIYSKYLPKGTHPFMFLRLLVAPKNIDVNIHPTKSEVKILHEDQIIEIIQQKIDEELSVSSNSKTFSTQVLLPGFDNDQQTSSQKKQKTSATASQTKSSSSSSLKDNKVRSDSRTQTLHAFLNPLDFNDADADESNDNSRSSVNNKSKGENESGDFRDNEGNDDTTTKNNTINSPTDQDNVNTKKRKSSSLKSTDNQELKNQVSKMSGHTFVQTRKTRKYKQVELTSIRSLISQTQDDSHEGLQEFFNNCVFVGCLDHAYALAQFGKKLYLLNVETITKELFYQLSLSRFSDFDSIRFSQPLSVYTLLLVSLDSPASGWMESDGPKDKIADHLTNLIISKKDLLKEYFSIEIDDQGMLTSIPQVLDHYVPCTDNLPIFLLKLSTEVEWEFEKECLLGIVKEISSFYKIEPSFIKLRDLQNLQQQQQQQQQDKPNQTNVNYIKKDGKEWTIQHLIFPAFRKLLPPKRFANDGSVIQITSLDNLYKVFERC
ncbi:hypothetical protein DICPUDRAFT_55923 [Dictyostelium purpureum]|uniref:DNA mismatch repair protein S5 domain-containing protein n=1 Tax=Dictyostelium purpureum TaxID=5786 RepID=F0ZP44_DICPU|nr:uncharacterized protein DICPUDRAFT_55923 [Dictyostelium purpureum]EGC34291.1 hypothetical protein DICPUDRAFT_55923 [Dictyostelium purpureum]|eukprot:XP_003289173.1 hypothetical protein DICPUDRAFT_55923 [Dictyostelium purpureum]